MNISWRKYSINPNSARALASVLLGVPAQQISPEITQPLFIILRTTLRPREEFVLSLLLNFYSSNEKSSRCTLTDISSILHITKERVRQIEAKILRKLRHKFQSWQIEEQLKDFVNVR